MGFGVLRGCGHTATRVSWQEFYLQPCSQAARTFKLWNSRSFSSYLKFCRHSTVTSFPVSCLSTVIRSRFDVDPTTKALQWSNRRLKMNSPCFARSDDPLKNREILWLAFSFFFSSKLNYFRFYEIFTGLISTEKNSLLRKKMRHNFGFEMDW